MQLKNNFISALTASRALNMVSSQKIDKILVDLAVAAVKYTDKILEANALDLAKMSVDNPMYDRLLLTAERIKGISEDILNVSTLPSPLGIVLNKSIRPNGMQIEKISVPFGVIGVIYEARPNVSFDVFALCLKSGNASILKGGSDADNSNRAIVDVIKEVLIDNSLDENIVTLLSADRQATAELLGAVGYVDLLIPRGSKGLIDFVRDNAKIPVIETGAGICHTYFDKSGDIKQCADIVFNAKTRRVSVCNALDCLIIHRDRVGDLAVVCERLATKNVEIYADSDAYEALNGKYPAEFLHQATDESFGTEFLSYTMSIRTVSSIEEAIEHITRYSSKHSEAIVSRCEESINLYKKAVDAACVYVNVSTAFTDGAQFGLGAEIGISTQKLHSRGPMGLAALTSYKYLITGDGQVRS